MCLSVYITLALPRAEVRPDKVSPEQARAFVSST